LSTSAPILAVMTSTREALIAAAADLLDRGGPEAVTLREVGRAAGVSHNAPYKHFADKSELLAAIAARELSRQSEIIAARDGPVLSARDLMHGYVRRALRYPERFKLTFRRWERDAAGLGEAASQAHGLLVAAVTCAQAAGELPSGDPERMSSLVRGLAHGAADLALSGHLKSGGKGNADPDTLVDDLFDYLRLAAAK